jgi:hypothetical protein
MVRGIQEVRLESKDMLTRQSHVITTTVMKVSFSIRQWKLLQVPERNMA